MGGVTNKQSEEPEEVVEEMPRRRKGLIFSSSIGKHTDVESKTILGVAQEVSSTYGCEVFVSQ